MNTIRLYLILFIALVGSISFRLLAAKPASLKKDVPYPNPERYEGAIRAFEERDRKDPPPKGAIVCTGSSSMRLWHASIKDDLAPLTVIPRGFGGSNMNDALYYADRIIIAYKPRAVVIYEGDNDIAFGITPEKVQEAFNALTAKTHKALPKARIYFLSIKPSIRRWSKWQKMREANRLIEAACAKNELLTYIDVASPMLDEAGKPKKEIFRKDMLHLNEKGYELWKKAVRPVLIKGESQKSGTK